MMAFNSNEAAVATATIGSFPWYLSATHDTATLVATADDQRQAFTER